MPRPGLWHFSVIPGMAQPLSGIHGKEGGGMWIPDIRNADSGMTKDFVIQADCGTEPPVPPIRVGEHKAKAPSVRNA